MIMDSETTVQELRLAVGKFVDERSWGPYHNPKNLGISIAIEAAEIMEHFQWLTPEQSRELVRDPAKRAEAADELADVLIYCLSLASQMDVDISTIILEKLERNRGRFPIGSMPS
jgi:NTP pyrophosphatase (non-canonical NTP hydrolase)